MSKLPIENSLAARVMQKRGRRNAVCGTPVDVKDLHDYVCASHPKTPSERQFLKEVVCKHPLFMHLNPSQIASVVGAFKVISCNSGDVLITQGDLDAQLFYVVGEGECSVLVSVPEDLKTIKVATKVRGDCFGELALMTISPRAATVMVTSNSASVFTLERQDFQHFVVSSGMRAAHHFITTSILPEAPEVPDNYMIVPKSTPFHPNCIALLPQPELSRDPSDASQAARPRAFSAASPGSPALARFHGLLLQPWPDALNDSLVDVLVPDIDPKTPQKVSARSLMRLNPLIQSTTENLIDLAHLSSACIVEVLKNRYEWDLIYTAVGSMLIAINPYREIAHSVSTNCAELYLASSLTGLETLAPHVFSVATRAWLGLQGTNAKAQSIIISGESGAGKTENTKFVLKALCQKRNSSLTQDVSSKLLAMNPITESFGNACTVRNRNSSRFGKYIDISFDSAGDISGCLMHSYLLEKTRVVTQTPGERNYHIFYQMLAWAERESARYLELHLLPRTNYRYLSGQGDKQFADINDYDDFVDMIDALHECDLSEDDILQLLRVVALVINLGNLSFNGRDGKEAVDECEVSDDAAAHACCACMRVQREDLTQAFCTFDTKMGMTAVTSKIGNIKAGELRDAFAKMVMTLLFDDLISKINRAFKGAQEAVRKIGVLDIFGFEIFDKNSLEQLCINYTNEKLQQVFCHHSFVLEQQYYSHEGIKWDHIHFEDNHICIDLFEAQGTAKDPTSWGLFKLLEEQCRLTHPSDEAFFESFKKNWHPVAKEKKGAVSVTPAKLQRDCFTIAHYASDVSYNINGLVEKNVDAFSPSLRHLIFILGNPFLKSIFPSQMHLEEENSETPNDRGSVSGRNRAATNLGTRVESSKITVTSSFKQQVLTLMSKINQTAPQFVRCIKPNMDKRDSFFDSTVAERQIVTGGIVDAVNIVQQGFPYRRLCNHFATEYSHLVPALRSADYAAALAAKKPSISVSDALKTHTSIFRKRSSVNGDGASSSASPRSDRIPDTERCLIILQHLRISQDRFAVGHTLLFLKSGVVGLLEDESNRQRYYYQVLISKNVMRFLVLTRYKAIRRALMLIQCAYRCSRARVTLRLRRKIVVQALQKYIRRCLYRVAYVKSYAARSLDAACRRSRDRRSYHAQLNQIYHKSKVDALTVLSPACLRALETIRYSRFIKVRKVLCLACGPALKRLLRTVKFRQQYAALVVGYHMSAALLATRHRKKFSAYLIGLRFKSRHVLPEFLDNPIRVAFLQKRQFQGTLEKKVPLHALRASSADSVSESNNDLQVNFIHWNKRFFRLNFANGSIEYQTQEGVGEFYGELFFSKDSAVEKQGSAFRLSGTPNRKNLQKSVYLLRASSDIEADRWVENLKKLIDEVKRRPEVPKKPAFLSGR